MSQGAQSERAESVPEPAPAVAPQAGPPMFRWFDSAGVDDIHTVISEFFRRCDEQAEDRTPRERLADVLAKTFSPDERRVLIRQMGASPEDVVPGAKIAAEEAWTIVEYFEHRSRFEDLLARVRRDRPSAFLRSVEEALVALLAGVDPRFVATLPTVGTPADRMLLTLHRLNCTERLADGTVPFVAWLNAAMQLIGPIPEADVLRRALAAMQQPRAGSAPASLLVPPASKPMGRAVLRFDIPFESFTDRERGMMLHALAGLLKIPVEEIRVEKIEEGSVKVTIALPEQAAARLASDTVATELAELKPESVRVRPLSPLVIRELHLNRDLDLVFARDLARDLALDLALARSLALDLAPDLDVTFAPDDTLPPLGDHPAVLLDRALDRSLALALAPDLDRARGLARELAHFVDRLVTVDRLLAFARVFDHDLGRALAHALARARDLAHALAPDLDERKADKGVA